MSECNSVECNFTELTYYHRNRAVVLNRAKANYENYKGRLREQARDKYRNISEEVKIKRENMEKNRYRNMYQEKKRLKEYQKNYRETKKSQCNNK